MLKEEMAAMHLMGKDNEARCYPIIYRLPNRFEPKTTASATGAKSIMSMAQSVKESQSKIEIINDRQREEMVRFLLAAQW